MKVLWIVNSVLNDLSVHLYNKESNGVWMDALLTDFKSKAEVDLVVATAARVKECIRYEKDGVVYYVLPNDYPILYKENKAGNRKAWKALLAQEKPDVIHVFGTEFTHGLCALRENKDIPVVLHMQGVLSSIARFYQAGLTDKEFRIRTLRDWLKRDGMCQAQKRYMRSAKKEAEVIRLSKNVISENEWCDAYVKSVDSNVKIFRRAESMNPIFFQTPWDAEGKQAYSIACNASGYPIKGLHILLKAVALLKKKYLQVKLYIPGTPMGKENSLKGRLRRGGYAKYVQKLIRELDLEEQVVWLGYKTQKDLAEHNRKMHVFVMPSVIENHSNSLKEAMMQGLPCVASAVGGVTSYAEHGKEALLYRAEEFETLAWNVEKYFENEAYAKELAANGRARMEKLHAGAKIYEETLEIYRQVIKND